MTSGLDRLGALPYGVALKGLQTAAKALPGRPEIWARNSYVLGTLVPLVSDLDLTVWYESEPKAGEISALSTLLRGFGKAVPFLGEANVYVADEVEKLSPLLNQFELLRDPALGQKLRSRLEIGSKVQGAVFLLRMLESDIHNVLNRPDARKNKWNSHVKAVESVTGIELIPIWHGYPGRSLLRGILDAVTGLALSDEMNDEKRSHVTESLEMYFECTGRGVPRHVLSPVYSKDSWWWTAMPHRFCFDLSLGQPLAGIKAELTEGQLSWELWGIASQHRLLSSSEARAGAATHLSALAAFARTTLPNQSKIIKHIDALLATHLRAR